MNLEVFDIWLGERIYDINNPFDLIVETEIKRKQQAIKIVRKQQRANIRDFQRIITKVLQLPQIWKKIEMQNKRKTLDVAYVTKVIRFQTVKL